MVTKHQEIPFLSMNITQSHQRFLELQIERPFTLITWLSHETLQKEREIK